MVALMGVLVFVSWLRGGCWERLAAAALVLDWAVSSMVQDKRNLAGPQYGFLIVEGAFFAVFAIIALRSRLWWATWAAGFLLFGVSIHVAMIVDRNLDPYAYYVGIGLYSYLILGAVLVGTLARRPVPGRFGLLKDVLQGRRARGPVPYGEIIALIVLIVLAALTIPLASGSGIKAPPPLRDVQ